MQRFSRSHVSDDALHHSAVAHAESERGCTADLLADLAEIDVRRFFLAMAYPSLFAYCVAELKLSADAAYKRIKVARAGRRFPVIFGAVADGRLNLSGVAMLAPHLTETTAPELLPAAMNKSNLEIEKLLAEAFPRPDVPSLVAPIATTSIAAPEARHGSEPADPATAPVEQAAGHVEEAGPPAHMQLVASAAETQQAARPVDSDIRSKVKPLAPGRYYVQFTMGQSALDKLAYLQDLLGFAMHSNDLGRVFEDALDARIREVEKQKLAATSQPRKGRRRDSKNPRHIPARVRRAVWKRDGARCTFVSETGRRCEATRGLQFDHVVEVARGGEASVDDIQLRCWAHNQYTAERTFGAEFMRHKRIAAAERRAAAATQVRSRAAPAP
jgi:5-methylcytosine-specific restriction endonuclease McrA